MVVVGFVSSDENGEVVWFAGEVLYCICPNLRFIVVSDAAIGYKAGMGEVEVPRWGGKDVNVGGGEKVCCKGK